MDKHFTCTYKRRLNKINLDLFVEVLIANICCVAL